MCRASSAAGGCPPGWTGSARPSAERPFRRRGACSGRLGERAAVVAALVGVPACRGGSLCAKRIAHGDGRAHELVRLSLHAHTSIGAPVAKVNAVASGHVRPAGAGRSAFEGRAITRRRAPFPWTKRRLQPRALAPANANTGGDARARRPRVVVVRRVRHGRSIPAVVFCARRTRRELRASAARRDERERRGAHPGHCGVHVPPQGSFAASAWHIASGRQN